MNNRRRKHWYNKECQTHPTQQKMQIIQMRRNIQRFNDLRAETRRMIRRKSEKQMMMIDVITRNTKKIY